MSAYHSVATVTRYSTKISRDQNDTDAEKTKKKVFDVFTQTEFDTSSSCQVSLEDSLSTTHGYFEHSAQNFLNQPALLSTHYTSLKFVDDVELPSSRNDTLRNNIHLAYFHTDYLSSQPATHPRKELSGKMTKFFNSADDPIRSYHTI